MEIHGGFVYLVGVSNLFGICLLFVGCGVDVAVRPVGCISDLLCQGGLAGAIPIVSCLVVLTNLLFLSLQCPKTRRFSDQRTCIMEWRYTLVYPRGLFAPASTSFTQAYVLLDSLQYFVVPEPSESSIAL